MKYMKVLNENAGRQISRLLYKLTMPENELNATTTQLVSCFLGDDGSWWVEWDVGAEIPINQNRSLDSLIALQYYVKIGLLSEESAAALSIFVKEKEGEIITLGEITPSEWLAAMSDDHPVKEKR